MSKRKKFFLIIFIAAGVGYFYAKNSSQNAMPRLEDRNPAAAAIVEKQVATSGAGDLKASVPIDKTQNNKVKTNSSPIVGVDTEEKKQFLMQRKVFQ